MLSTARYSCGQGNQLTAINSYLLGNQLSIITQPEKPATARVVTTATEMNVKVTVAEHPPTEAPHNVQDVAPPAHENEQHFHKLEPMQIKK